MKIIEDLKEEVAKYSVQNKYLYLLKMDQNSDDKARPDLHETRTATFGKARAKRKTV